MDRINRVAKVSFLLFSALFMIIFWPFWMLVKRFQNLYRASSGTTEENFDAKERNDEDLVVSARAQIIEVAIESSFQPLLQLFLLLPTLVDLVRLNDLSETLSLFSPADVFESVERRQFWSISTSIISLSWSFTFYQSVQKKGALDFGSNLSGRILLLIANFLQLFTRLLVLVLYAYICGNFWPMIVSVIIHIIIMAVLHYLTSNEWEMEAFHKKPLAVAYHCLINGICNLYLHNWIAHINNASGSNEVKTIKKHGTIFRQILFDTIFLVENFVTLIMAGVLFNECLTTLFLMVAGTCQCVGVLLKILYYKKFHIWKDAMTNQMCIKNILHYVTSCLKMKKKESKNRIISNETKNEESILMLESGMN